VRLPADEIIKLRVLAAQLSPETGEVRHFPPELIVREFYADEKGGGRRHLVIHVELAEAEAYFVYATSQDLRSKKWWRPQWEELVLEVQRGEAGHSSRAFYLFRQGRLRKLPVATTINSTKRLGCLGEDRIQEIRRIIDRSDFIALKRLIYLAEGAS
jgi:hypothetical protein